MMKMWSSRGGAIPTRFPGRGGGLNSGSMLPTFSMPKPSSTVWPEGASKRIASPQPGPSSPLPYRFTGMPTPSTRSV